MQDWVEPQSFVTAHTGAASPAVTQNPPWQMLASPHVQQSPLVTQAVRHAPFTHIRPLPQSVFALQDGRGRSSARHRPLTQRSSAVQSLSTLQAPRQ